MQQKSVLWDMSGQTDMLKLIVTLGILQMCLEMALPCEL